MSAEKVVTIYRSVLNFNVEREAEKNVIELSIMKLKSKIEVLEGELTSLKLKDVIYLSKGEVR